MTRIILLATVVLGCGSDGSPGPVGGSAILTVDPSSPGKKVVTVGGSNHTGFTAYAPQQGMSLVPDLRKIPYGLNRIVFIGQTPPGSDDFNQLPMKSNGSWDFSAVDKVVRVALELRKNGGPDFIFSIAYCPPFLSVNDTASLRPKNDAEFALYCARIVRYYNTAAGFVDDLGVSRKIVDWAAERKILHWEIWNEPDDTLYVQGNPAAFSPAEFKATFLAASAAMRAVDGQIKIGGPNTAWLHKKYLDELLESPAAAIDFVSTHQYLSEASDSDAQIFAKAGGGIGLAIPPQVPWVVGEINAVSDWNDERMMGPFELAYMPLAYRAHIEAGTPNVIRWETVETAFPLLNQDGSRHRNYWMERHFWSAMSPGSTLVACFSSSPDVVGLAVLSEGKLRVVAINKGTHTTKDKNGSGVSYDIEFSGLPAGKYESVVVDRTTNPQEGPVPSVFDADSVRLTIVGYGMAVVRQQ